MRLGPALRRWGAATISLDARRKRWAVARILPSGGVALLCGVGAVTVIAGLLPAAFTVSTGVLVGAVASAARSGGSHHHVIVALGVVTGLFLAQQLGEPILETIKSQLGWRLTDVVFQRVVACACDPVGIGHLEDPAMLDKFDLAQGAGSANTGPGPAAEGLIGFAQRRIQGWAALAVLARFSPLIALVLLLELSVSYRLYVRGLEAYAARWAANDESFRRAQYFRTLGLDPQGGKELRVFGLGGWVADRYRSLFTGAMSVLWAKRSRQTAGQLVPIALDLAGLSLALGALARAATTGRISIGELTAYAGAALGTVVLTQLGNDELMITWGGQAQRALIDLEGAVAALSDSALDSGDDAAELPRTEIRFEHVSFAYPGREPVFDDLDLTIPAGSSLAIVGTNGAGKTTLVKLLCRLYEPTSGRITVDGIDLRDLDAHSWQRRVAAIFQDFIKYEAYSAADNIGLGRVERLGDRDAIVTAARRAGAQAVIESAAAGWDAPMSRQYTDGIDVSGGEWQRLALARALFATAGGAGVLVLDEPTSNLDVRGETEVYDRFLDMTRGVTTIVISHRFSTVRRANRIVVIDGGRVCEEGTHEELIAAGGFYAEMFSLQASRYAEAASDG